MLAGRQCNHRMSLRITKSLPPHLQRHWPLYLILFLAAIVRLDYLTWLGVQFAPDTDSYIRATDRILQLKFPIDPVRTPTYPFFLVLNFILFGYHNFVAVVCIQGLLGIASAGLLYGIGYQITSRRSLAFFIALLWTCNLHMLKFESFILTEGVASFFLHLTIYLILYAGRRNFSIRTTIATTFAVFVLIGLKPIFIVILPIPLLYSFTCRLSRRDMKRFVKRSVLYIALVMTVALAWCGSMRVQYGFFGVSIVGPINLLGVVGKNGVYQYAPAKYQPIVDIIDKSIEETYPEKFNQWRVYDEIAKGYPRRSPYDYGVLSRFSLAAILRAPGKMANESLKKIPLIFQVVQISSKYQKAPSLVSEWCERLYSLTLLRLHHQYFWLVVLILSTSAVLVGGRKNIDRRADLLAIVCTIWIVIGTLTVSSSADYGRLRMPLDGLIILTTICGIYYPILHIRGLIFKSETQNE